MTKSAKAKAEEEKDEPKNKVKQGDDSDKLTSLKDNSVSAGEMAATKGGTKSPLAVTGDDIAQADKEETDRRAKEDNSIAARLARTEYVLNENEITGERWVGLSIQRDPDADAASKAKTKVTGIAEIPPRKGLTVKPKNGEPFVVSEEFDRDSSPADWFAVLNGEGKPFLEGV